MAAGIWHGASKEVDAVATRPIRSLTAASAVSVLANLEADKTLAAVRCIVRHTLEAEARGPRPIFA
jgi:hypothetical protein